MTVTLEGQLPQSPPQPPSQPTETTIAQGILDANRVEAPRWVRLNFEVPVSGTYTITLPWTNSSADVRFRVNNANGTNLSSTIRDQNPGVWEGTLNANTDYFIGVWSTDGITNYTATIGTSDDL